MTFVVAEACMRCKYTDCFDMRPVDALCEGSNFVVVDPDQCIDCAVCVPEQLDVAFAPAGQPPDGLADYCRRTCKDENPLAGNAASSGGGFETRLMALVPASSACISTRSSSLANGAPGQTCTPAP